MAIIASSVTALQLLRTFKCPHCGKVQTRMLPEEGRSLECQNCLKQFTPKEALVEKPKPRKRKR